MLEHLGVGQVEDAHRLHDEAVPGRAGQRAQPHQRAADEAAQRFPGIDFVKAAYLRDHPLLLDAFVELAGAKTPRGMVRLADSGVIQAEIAKCEAKLGAARAYLLDTLAEIYETADSVAPIDIERP